MRLTRLLGATLGTGFLFLVVSSGANAWDGYRDRDYDYWRHQHSKHEHWKHEHWRHEHPVVVRERPMVVERPVMVERPMMVAPQPMYMTPMMPMQQGPSGPSLNFNIPLN